MSGHTAKVSVEADYSPHWEWECADPTECQFFNEDNGECNAVVWLSEDDATNECLRESFIAWSGPVDIRWEGFEQFYSFQPILAAPLPEPEPTEGEK